MFFFFLRESKKLRGKKTTIKVCRDRVYAGSGAGRECISHPTKKWPFSYGKVGGLSLQPRVFTRGYE